MRYKSIMKRIAAAALGVMLAANSLSAYAENNGAVGMRELDVTDISMALSYIKGITSLDDEELVRLDVNADGAVNVTDLAMISGALKGVSVLPEDTVADSSVWELSSVSGASVLGGGCGKLVALKKGGKSKDKTGGEYIVVSTSADDVVRSFVSDINLRFVGIKKSGTVIMAGNDPKEGSMLYYYQAGKTAPKKLGTAADYQSIKYDEKNDMLYCQKDNVISIIEKDGTLKELYKAADGEMFKGMELSQMVGAVCTDGEGEGLNGLSLVSLSDGQPLWDTVMNMGSTAFTEDIALVCDGLGTQADGSELSAVRCFDLRTGEKKGIYKVKGSVSKLCFSSDSYCGMIAGTELTDCITFFDTAKGRCAQVDVGIKGMYVTGGICLDDGRWAVNVSVEDSTTGRSSAKTFVVSADKLIWTDAEAGTDIEDVFKPVTCGEALAAQREKADRLQEKYGITILIGDEVKNAYSGMISAETDMYADYPEQLDAQLDALSIWLSTYPEGFFEKFKTSENKKGYRLLFAGGFEGENVVAKTSKDRNYVDVALSIRSSDRSFYTDLDHETWHAVEYMADAMGISIDKSGWDALQPSGFTYNGVHGGGYRSNILNNGYHPDRMGDIAFIRDYSMENEHEDRATMMEYVAPSLSVFTGYNSYYELERFPVLKAKLDMMSEVSRKCFGYVYWEEMVNRNVNYQIGYLG